MASTSASAKKITLKSSDGEEFVAEKKAVMLSQVIQSKVTSALGKKITLKSSDGEEFVVEENAVRLSSVIRNMIKDKSAESVIPLPNVNSKVLAMVIEYCKKKFEIAKEISKTPVLDVEIFIDRVKMFEELERWETTFLQVDHTTLIELLEAAIYLDIHPLTELTGLTIADMIEVKAFEEELAWDSHRVSNLLSSWAPSMSRDRLEPIFAAAHLSLQLFYSHQSSWTARFRCFPAVSIQICA